jgi:hypothetical protein
VGLACGLILNVFISRSKCLMAWNLRRTTTSFIPRATQSSVAFSRFINLSLSCWDRPSSLYCTDLPKSWMEESLQSLCMFSNRAGNRYFALFDVFWKSDARPLSLLLFLLFASPHHRCLQPPGSSMELLARAGLWFLRFIQKYGYRIDCRIVE